MSYRFQNWYKYFDGKYDGDNIKVKYAEFSEDGICRAIVLNVFLNGKKKVVVI